MIRKTLLIICVFALCFTALPTADAKLSSKDWNAAKKRLEKLLSASNAPTDEVVSAIRKVAEDNSDRAVKLLLTVGLKIEVASIYQATKQALASITDQKGMKLIRKEIENKSDAKWMLKVMLVEVVGRMPGSEKIEILTKLAQEANKQEVLFAVIRAFRVIDDGMVIGPLIDLFDRFNKKKGRVWMDTKQALYDITGGEDFEDPRDWRNWWEGVKGSWEKPKADEDDESGTSDESKGYRTSAPKKTPTFFGTEVTSKLVVFVLDTSGSMKIKDPGDEGEEEPKKATGKTTVVDPSKKKKDPQAGAGKNDPQAKLPEHRMRIRRAQKELIQCIQGLDPDVMFNIVTYDSTTTTWSKGGLKLANAANKTSAIKYVKNFKPRGTTHTDDAIKRAFKENKNANTIYLLSDGWPTHKGDNSDSDEIIKGIWDFLEKANKFRKVRIFTFGFVDAHRRFMVELAEKNGGRYKDIR
ncbi:MAG: VWA domain-containing protein [Planctomycetota bacterium]|jgi:hypothetical protein